GRCLTSEARCVILLTVLVNQNTDSVLITLAVIFMICARDRPRGSPPADQPVFAVRKAAKTTNKSGFSSEKPDLFILSESP
ncbi:MAG: hypothetical protein IJH52_00795, partial [Oscillospiraceae bacterium]|nr:hypothetical protein [Oscillospiraceae bacterium]